MEVVDSLAELPTKLECPGQGCWFNPPRELSVRMARDCRQWKHTERCGPKRAIAGRVYCPKRGAAG